MNTGKKISKAFNEDCMIGMARFPDKFFDLAIVDPPYGIKEHGGKCRTGFAIQKNGSKRLVRDPGYSKKNWDNCSPLPEYFHELFRVSKEQIIWGENHFPSFGKGRIVWDKVNHGGDQCACEIAFYSGNERIDLVRYMWRGMMQGESITKGMRKQGNVQLNEKRIHPTQKPIALYRWLLNKYGIGCNKILDTHMGSQSSRIAAYHLGFSYWGWEIDKDYFQAGCKRFKEETAQLCAFALNAFPLAHNQ
ncbi:methyltransferase [Puia dinghuensis]|uniref:Methyltransferase n=2 Tax=Puia dinghuensis TaxID=1792502 RepID=A0A8J2UBN0_9BACT|nr:methyltransferase [Puia dinghuensis]